MGKNKNFWFLIVALIATIALLVVAIVYQFARIKHLERITGTQASILETQDLNDS